MKLYNEEQIRKVLHPDLFHLILPQMQSIELPSNEKIDEKSNFLFPNANRIGSSTYIAYKGFIEGAIWMKTQILNQNL